MNDLTQGKFISNVIKFSIPFFLSYFLQTLYGMADLFIIGQFDGTKSISAVSIGSQVMHMVTVLFVGLAVGSSVLIGRHTGAKDHFKISQTIAHTIILFGIISLISTFVFYSQTSYFVYLLKTPIEAVSQTESYLKVCFLGIPFIIAYNVISSLLRGMGDSKSPFYFISIACFINIVLDYLFIGYFHMHSYGAALATILAQMCSVCIAIFYIKSKQMIELHKNHFQLHILLIKDILIIGFPVALQDGFIQISFLIITMIANKRGLEISAAVGIVEKIISFLFLIPSTMMSTISTMTSQAIGANKPELGTQVLSLCLKICIIFGLSFILIFNFYAYPIVRLFTDQKNVLIYANQYIKSYVLDALIASIHFCFSGFFVAYGYSYISFIHNLLSIILLRIPVAYYASLYYPTTLFPMGLAAPLGSSLQVIICLIFYYFLKKKSMFKSH